MITFRTQDIRTLLAPSVVLIALISGVAYLAPKFVYGSDMLARPIIPFVIIMMLSGVAYLFAVRRVLKVSDTRNVLLFIVLVGLLLRALLLFTNPILEDDYYRYLWEGGVTANGHNPYALSPNDVFMFEDDNVPKDLVVLADESGRIADRVNHPSLGTVYPPVAQAAFAIAHGLKPWSLLSWKMVLLVCDALTLCLLLAILKHTGLPRPYALIYWWNPILLKETYNSAHMDMVILFFLMLGVYYIVQQKLYRSGIALSFAVATKLWPLMIIPLLLRSSHAPGKDITKALALSALVLGIILSPMLWAIPLGDRSGFLAYGESWEMNDALFMIVEFFVRFITTPFTLFEATLESLTRMTVGALLLAWVIVLLRKPVVDAPDIFNRLVLAVGALFMLSPTQFPWYYLWILPFLAFSPRPSLLLLTPMLPMYYLKFYYSAKGDVDFFHNTLVWIEYAPVLLYSAYEFYCYKVIPIPMKENHRA